MKKIIIALAIFIMGSVVYAAGWAELLSTPYSQTDSYVVPQANGFSVVQPANPAYDNMFYQNPNQVQCQVPYTNPYLYRSPYGQINPYSYRANPVFYSPYNTTAASATTNLPKQIVRNIGQSMLYSMRRGY